MNSLITLSRKETTNRTYRSRRPLFYVLGIRNSEREVGLVTYFTSKGSFTQPSLVPSHPSHHVSKVYLIILKCGDGSRDEFSANLSDEIGFLASQATPVGQSRYLARAPSTALHCRRLENVAPVVSPAAALIA